MDSKELMLGDLVKHGFGGIGKITEIDSKTVVIKDDGFDIGNGMNEVSFALNELTPIPITPEMLEKNGFKTRIHEDFYSINTDYYDLYIALCTDGLWEVVYSNCEFNFEDWRMYVSYTHELQHALRLCGINKEIEI